MGHPGLGPELLHTLPDCLPAPLHGFIMQACRCPERPLFLKADPRMGYNTIKTPFNLAEFLSEKAPKRPYKRRMAYAYSRGSEAVTVEPEEAANAETTPAEPSAT